MTYWDTSSLIKLYAVEADSPVFRTILLNQVGEVAISQLQRTEVYFGLFQKEMRGEISKGKASEYTASFDSNIEAGMYVVLPWGADTAENSRRVLDRCYASQPQIPIRSLDGIHLGMAYAAGIKRIVTADIRMKDAAVVMGFDVVGSSN